MKTQLPPRHPPLPPIRISLNLDEIPCDQSPTFPVLQVREQVSFNKTDLSMMAFFMNNQTKPRNIAESNFASAFVSQSEILEEDQTIQVPQISTHKNTIDIFSKKISFEKARRKEPRNVLRRNV